MRFPPFDPLQYKSTADTEVAANALKREIGEILNSYVGWYDPFCELIQNALDSLDKRSQSEDETYKPTLNIRIDLAGNRLSVTDNGTGLTHTQFNQFLVPFFSFKSGNTRGHKGVGATYLAYGFNYIQVCTKSQDFEAKGKMLGAKNWLTDPNPSGNPTVEYDAQEPIDPFFSEVDNGVSVTVKFDSTTHPRSLKWIGTDNAETWMKILRVKTGIGSIMPDNRIEVKVKVIQSNQEEDGATLNGTKYLFLEDFPNVRRSIRIRDLNGRINDHFERHGLERGLPDSLKNFDCIYDTWISDELASLIDLNDFESEMVASHNPLIYCGYAYSANVFKNFNEQLGVRSRYSVIEGGYQIASNNMPQGEINVIPLRRYIGRQKQIHFVIHFENYNADLGRKGYHKDIKDFCNSVTDNIVRTYLKKFKPNLRATSGASADIFREAQVQDWKNQMASHQENNPIDISNENFFLPTNNLGILSVPTREQDVIALFNQLIAGGVIRGIRIMSTNERFTYDGLYRIFLTEPVEHHLFDQEDNPLGVLEDKIIDGQLPFTSHPLVLEYKFSLDGLMEDIADETKNSNDIGLVIAWETGSLYQENYHITSLIDEDNLSLRQYHGVTHVMTNLTTNQREMDLIVLSELISYLNDRESELVNQRTKYNPE